MLFINISKRICCVLICCGLFAVLGAQTPKKHKKAPAPAPSPESIFDSVAQENRKIWQTPGFSVAVVKDGKVVFKKGYGVRELGKTEPFESNTLAEAASTTKAMTAMCLALLVEEGRIKWTDKVADIYPEFALSDPWLTWEVTIRDLLTHNAGLDNADFLWYGNNISADEMVRRLRYLKPAYSLRSSYTYQNIMYLVAGKVVEKVSGKTWEQFMADRIFKPLGMNRSFPSHAYAQSAPNQTAQHFQIEDKVELIPLYAVDQIAPAGAVWTCADDMAKWMLFLLDSTKTPDGKRWLKPASFAELFKPQALIPQPMFYPTTQLTRPHWTSYGLGWFQHDYRGQMLQFHTGSIDGAVAIVGLLPESKTGVCVFGNLDHAEMRHALMYQALDLWAFGDAGRDWTKEVAGLYRKIKEEGKLKKREKEGKRIPGTQPSLPLQAYLGRYSDPLYGTAVVRQENGRMFLKTNVLEMELEHWHYDVFKAVYLHRWLDQDWVQFSMNADEKVQDLSLSNMKFKKVE